MDYTGFAILWKVILLFALIYGFYYMFTHLSIEWSTLILTAYLHCYFLFISFFPVA